MGKTFSATKTAKLLGIAVPTVCRWCESGKIKATKTLTNYWKVPISEINKLLSKDNK